MTEMPVLESERIIIRPFVTADLQDIRDFLHVDEQWMQWAVMNHGQLARLNQPPYGDRAIVLRSSAEVVGAAGYVPCFGPFEQLPGIASIRRQPRESRWTTELGLFYAVSPEHRRCGYASEAARSLLDYAFKALHAKRVIATTDRENPGSIGVMRRVGMRIVENPSSEPPWLQVVGVLENQ
jgi:ribosomal-protein-alanine N-acetyltransferase